MIIFHIQRILIYEEETAFPEKVKTIRVVFIKPHVPTWELCIWKYSHLWVSFLKTWYSYAVICGYKNRWNINGCTISGSLLPTWSSAYKQNLHMKKKNLIIFANIWYTIVLIALNVGGKIVDVYKISETTLKKYFQIPYNLSVSAVNLSSKKILLEILHPGFLPGGKLYFLPNFWYNLC